MFDLDEKGQISLLWHKLRSCNGFSYFQEFLLRKREICWCW